MTKAPHRLHRHVSRGCRQKRQQVESLPAQAQDTEYVLNQADFEGMSDSAFAFLRMIDASPAFRAVLADLAAK